ncbi:MAG: YbaB/EbfC family nucleoid-associated protein [Patescibacteria group bacterium]|nr:YbaB/EbfC family nucleoid-associated protein [Patescibacteria group bacterium]
MSMFSKLKQFKELRSAAKSLQQELAQEQVITERNGITLTFDGNLDVKSLVLPPGMSTDELQRRLPEVINQAIDKTQRMAAEKIRKRGGLEGLGLGGN